MQQTFFRKIFTFILIWVFLSIFGCTSHAPMPTRDTIPLDPNIKTRTYDGWFLVQNTPVKTKYKVLLLPGFLCTDVIYRDMLADTTVPSTGIEYIAGDPPGFKGMPTDENVDFSIENYAKRVCDLNDVENFDIIVGHSFFANVLIEVALSKRFQGRLILLSPTFSRECEDLDTRLFDRISRVPLVGSLTTAISYKAMHSLFAPYFIDEKKDKIDQLVIEAQKTPQPLARELIQSFFNHIDKYQDLSKRLSQTRIPVTIIRGKSDNVKLTDQQRLQLNKNPLITIKDIDNSKHFVMIDHPDQINEYIIKLIFGIPVDTLLVAK